MVGLCFAFLFGGVASRGIPFSPNGARRRYVYGVGSLEMMNIHPKHRGSRTLRSGSRRHRRRGHPRCGGALRRWPMRFRAPARAVLSLLMTMPVYSTAGVVPAADPTREEGGSHVRSLQSSPCGRHCPWEQKTLAGHNMRMAGLQRLLRMQHDSSIPNTATGVEVVSSGVERCRAVSRGVEVSSLAP